MRKLLISATIIAAVLGCERDPEPEIPDSPTMALLLFPYENSVCNLGTDLTSVESTILFEWEAGLHTDSYELNIEDLSDGTSQTHETSESSYSVTLKRGTPYAWNVLSRSEESSETAESETWKFYIAGDPVQSYAPFPAEILSPPMASTISAVSGVITLDWNGEDVDGDITAYDLYFGQESPPPLLQSNLSESILADVPVTSNTIYYWRVITFDSRGNKSDSGIFQFKVED